MQPWFWEWLGGLDDLQGAGCLVQCDLFAPDVYVYVLGRPADQDFESRVILCGAGVAGVTGVRVVSGGPSG